MADPYQDEMNAYMQWQQKEWGIPGLVASPELLNTMLAKSTAADTAAYNKAALDSQTSLGMKGYDVQLAGINAQTAASSRATDAQMASIAAQLGISKEQLANELALGQGQLKIQGQQLDLNKILGLGQLDLGKQAQTDTAAYQTGQLALGNRSADEQAREFDQQSKMAALAQMLGIAQGPLVQWYAARGEAPPPYLSDLWDSIASISGIQNLRMPTPASAPPVPASATPTEMPVAA